MIIRGFQTVSSQPSSLGNAALSTPSQPATLTIAAMRDNSQSDSGLEVLPMEAPNHSESNRSMDEFYALQKELLVTTLVLMGLIFGPVWYYYSLNTALNYLLGACTGVVYLKVLARNVEQLGTEKVKVGKSQVAIFVGVMVVASQWSQLHVLPVFLGFLTYKATLLLYTLRILFMPNPTSADFIQHPVDE